VAASTRDGLLALLTPIVAAHGMDLEDVDVTPAGKRRLVRIVIDKDGGVSLDDVAAVSGPVGAALDTAESLGSTPYVLEVTSPGISRPLTEPRHWRRAHGRLVEVTLQSGDPVEGRLVEIGEAGIVVSVDGVPRELAWGDVVRGSVQVEFTHATGPATSPASPTQEV
jgi:ribosome maturation factor RimP